MDNYSLYVLFAKDLHTIIFVENIFKYHHNPQYEDQLVKQIILRTWSCWNISYSGEEEWCLQQVDSVYQLKLICVHSKSRIGSCIAHIAYLQPKGRNAMNAFKGLRVLEFRDVGDAPDQEIVGVTQLSHWQANRPRVQAVIPTIRPPPHYVLFEHSLIHTMNM